MAGFSQNAWIDMRGIGRACWLHGFAAGAIRRRSAADVDSRSSSRPKWNRLAST